MATIFEGKVEELLSGEQQDKEERTFKPIIDVTAKRVMESLAVFTRMTEIEEQPEAVDGVMCAIMGSILYPEPMTLDQLRLVRAIWKATKDIVKEEGQDHGTD